MGRKDMTDAQRLQDKERKLKRRGRFFSGVIAALALVSLVLAWQSYTGRRDSWLFQEALKVGSMQESGREVVGVSEEVGASEEGISDGVSGEGQTTVE